MRALLFLIFGLLFLSCTNTSMEKNEVVINENVKKYSEDILVEEKFKEFYDLNVLIKKYPEFNSDISSRLKKFIFNSDTLLQIKTGLKIKNIQQKNSFKKISDSIYKTTLIYDLVFENEIKTDSINAFIIKKKLKIDSEEIETTKVKFSRN